MAASALKQGTGKELKRLLAALTASIGETFGSLVGREIAVHPGALELCDGETMVAGLPRPCGAARGALDKAFAGKFLTTLIEVPDAIALAGLLMMTPEDVVAQRRSEGVLDGEDMEAFGELGNVLCSGFGNVLREQLGNVDIRLQDRHVVKPGIERDDLFGSGPLVTLRFRMKVGEYPESGGLLVVDQQTAEAWNKAPLEPAGADVEAAAAPTPAERSAVARADDELLDSIPAAPIRGTLAAFVMLPEAFRTLRLSCRRVGLELRRHGRGEIPNPAAHRNEVVVIDVPPGEDRRFDWCRRIKEMSESTKVALLIHHPSRQRVTQAFLSRADAIVGFPCAEQKLSQKLGQLLDDNASGG